MVHQDLELAAAVRAAVEGALRRGRCGTDADSRAAPRRDPRTGYCSCTPRSHNSCNKVDASDVRASRNLVADSARERRTFSLRDLCPVHSPRCGECTAPYLLSENVKRSRDQPATSLGDVRRRVLETPRASQELVSSRLGASSACHSSQTCRRRIPCRWQPPCRPPCRAVQRHRVRRARLPKVMARAAAAVGVVRVSGFDVTRARWCPYIVPSSHGQRAALRERARSAYSESVESMANWACN